MFHCCREPALACMTGLHFSLFGCLRVCFLHGLQRHRTTEEVELRNKSISDLQYWQKIAYILCVHSTLWRTFIQCRKKITQTTIIIGFVSKSVTFKNILLAHALIYLWINMHTAPLHLSRYNSDLDIESVNESNIYFTLYQYSGAEYIQQLKPTEMGCKNESWNYAVDQNPRQYDQH